MPIGWCVNVGDLTYDVWGNYKNGVFYLGRKSPFMAALHSLPERPGMRRRAR